MESPRYTFFHNSNVPVYFFMSVVVAIFVGLIVSAEEIFRDRKILKRERYLNLSSSSYLISKIFILFSISAVQTISFILLGNWILEIPFSELRYWLILFSCSCFANLLGLNISSAFDSAVTIYILIPILIIPQLLLSGVVISFDKFNPSVGRPNGIPVMGELMASRWAFEAYMVTQFKDNPYEKQFYELDQQVALSEYCGSDSYIDETCKISNESITNALQSPRCTSASSAVGLHPTMHTTRASPMCASSLSVVASLSISDSSSYSRSNGSSADNACAHNHHNGAHVGCRSTILRAAKTKPAGSICKPNNACAVSLTSATGSAPVARAT